MTSEHTKFTCPDCGGALERLRDGNILQYRCRIGHLYSPKSAVEIHNDREENTLWNGVVLLEEAAELAEEIAGQDQVQSPQSLLESAKAKRALASRMREIVLQFPSAKPTL